MEIQKKRRLIRAFSVVSATVLLAFGAASAASAVSASTIDPDQTGTLSIHKFKKPETATGLAHDGRELPAASTAGLEPLPGVTFSVEQVDPASYNLTTNAGWTALQTLTPMQRLSQPRATPQLPLQTTTATLLPRICRSASTSSPKQLCPREQPPALRFL
nr:hypothetical protein [Leucobacter coleopterorum]